MSTPNAPLSPAVKLGFSAGEAATSLIYTLVYVFLMFFLTDVMQLSAAAAGVYCAAGRPGVPGPGSIPAPAA